MIADPCGATLLPGIHTTSEGILSRHRTINQPTGTETSGYVLWCPYYVSNTLPSVGPRQSACVYFQTNTPAIGPTNTVATPAFTVAPTTSGTTLFPGASTFVTGSTCADFRLVSACMRLTYTGPMTASAGTLAFIENLAPEAIFNTGVAGQVISVDQLIQNCQKYNRLGIETEEIIYRQDSQLSSEFHGDTISPLDLGDATIRATNQSEEAQRAQPTFFGFAWKGQAANQLSFEFIQNIEWRPAAQSGIVAPVPTVVAPPNQVTLAQKALDVHRPGWSTSAKGFVRGMNHALDIAQMAFTGVERASKMVSRYGPPAARWAARTAPMLL